MPIIPIQQNQIGLDVGGADLNTGAQGLVGTALAQAGSQAVQTGFALAEQLGRAEALEAKNLALTELDLRAKKKKKELEFQSLGGYMVDKDGNYVIDPVTNKRRSMTEEFRDWANNEYEAAQLNMPNRLGQKMIQQEGNALLTQDIGDVYSTELIKRHDLALENRKQWQQLAGNSLETLPNIDSTHEQLATLSIRINENIRANSLTPEEGARELREVSNYYAVKQFQGEINKIKLGETVDYVEVTKDGKKLLIPKGPIGTIDDLLNILMRKERDPLNPNIIDPKNEIGARKETELPSLDKALSPEARDQFIDQLLDLRQSLKKKGKSDFNYKVNDLTKMGEQGHMPTPDSIAKITAQAKQEIADGEPAQKIVGDLTEINVAVNLGQLLQQFATESDPFGKPSAASQVKRTKAMAEKIRKSAMELADELNDGSLDRDSVGGAAVAKFEQKLKEAISKNKSEYENAPATYLAKKDPEIMKVFKEVDLGDESTFKPDTASRMQRALTIMDDSIRSRAQVGERAPKERIPEASLRSLTERLKNQQLGVDNLAVHLDKVGGILGPKFYTQVLDQAIDKDHSLEDFRLAMYMKSPTEKRAAIKLAWAGNLMREKFISARGNKGEEDWNSLVEYMAKKTSPVTVNMFKDDADNTVRLKKAAQLDKVLAYQAAELVQKGQSKSDAIQSTYDQFIGRHFAVVDIGGYWATNNGERSQVIIPRYLNDGSHLSDSDIATLSKYGNRPLSDEVIKAKLLPPPNMGAITKEHFQELLTKSSYVARVFGDDPNGTNQQGWSLRFIQKGPSGNEISRIPIPTMKNGKKQIYFVPVRQSIIEQKKMGK